MGKSLSWVSIDAAATSGVAHWSGSDLISTASVAWPKHGPGYGRWEPELLGAHGLVIEGGYVGPGKRSSLVLAQKRGCLVGYAEALGVEVWGDALMPAEWRRAVGIPPNAKRSAAKASALRMCAWLATPPADRPAASGRWDALHLPAADGVSDDEAEAVLIGLAWLRISGAL